MLFWISTKTAWGGYCAVPGLSLWAILVGCLVTGGLGWVMDLSYFPRTDPGQFVINLKAVTGTRVELTEAEVAKLEGIIREIVRPTDLRLIVANIGNTPDFSAIYNSNSGSHTAFVQVSLQDDHQVGSYEYMDRLRAALREKMPEISVYFQSGGLVDAVLNLGLPAPMDVQVSGSNLDQSYAMALGLAEKIRRLDNVSDVLVQQDIDAPSLEVDVDRLRAKKMGLSQKEVVTNLITALTSNQMIAPSFWIDPHTGNDYMLTVQYPEGSVQSLGDLKDIPLRASASPDPTRLDMVTTVSRFVSPTEIDHYQLRRVIDVLVAPRSEDLGRLSTAIQKLIDTSTKNPGIKITLRGTVQAMKGSFQSFGAGLLLAVILVYLLLVAQFRSFKDPFFILLAVPPGLAGVLITLVITHTTLNVMSLMGLVMMVGIVVSNSILIVEFVHRLREDGMKVQQAVSFACRVRLRPILMTSLATVFGLIPMAAKMGTGSEAYAPLAKAIIGGLTLSVLVTVFLVPSALVLAYGRTEHEFAPNPEETASADARLEVER